MSFSFRKRINLGKGLGVNVSQAGASTSLRTKYGSIGSMGFSLKTGIPGLSYRGRFGKNLLPAVVVYIAIAIGVLVMYNTIRFIFFVFSWLYFNTRLIITNRRKYVRKNNISPK